MKLVMDEKLKHRLIGLAVIISLGAIFAPAVMKKSSSRIEPNLSVNVKLPPKPVAPEVAVTDEKDMFKTIKISRAEIPPVSEENQLPELAKAEILKSDQVTNNKEPVVAEVKPEIKSEQIQLALNEAAKNTAKKVMILSSNKPAKRPVLHIKQKNIAQIAKVKARQSIKKDVYAVQLASFSRISNAQALVSRLRNKGFKANFIKIKGTHGAVYKVYAGHSPRKNDVVKLKTQLASSLQLNGFIVNTGVS